MHLISPTCGPLDLSQAQQVLSDSNGDFAVIGLCRADAASSNVVAALGALLSGQQQQTGASATAPQPGTLQGLRMHVHPRDRIIVLDASHILSSPDVLAALLAPERPTPAVGTAAAAAVREAASRAGSGSAVPVEGVAALLGMQMLCFLLAVCNVVVVGSGDLELHLLQLLEACCHISSSIPDLTIPPAQLAQQQQQQQLSGVRGHSNPAVLPTAPEAGRSNAAAVAAAARRGRGQQLQQQQLRVQSGSSSVSNSVTRERQQQPTAVLPHHVADVVLLHSASSQQQLAPLLVQRLQELVDAALSGTVWSRRRRQLSSVPMVTAAGSQQQQQPHQQQQHEQQGSTSGGTHAASSSGVNVWVVPPLQGRCSSTSLTSHSNSVLEQQQPEQQEQPLQLPCHLPLQLHQLTNKLLAWPRSSSGGSSGCFSRQLSEREWLKAAERVWEAVQGSRELLQYYKAAAEVRYVGAGGWRHR